LELEFLLFHALRASVSPFTGVLAGWRISYKKEQLWSWVLVSLSPRYW
jgi:hypothetical protein